MTSEKVGEHTVAKKKQIKKKESFGGCDIDHFSPPLSEDVPKGINLAISFEDGLKLHLALGQILGQLNSYKRSTVAGKLSAINLCVYTRTNRITITETKLKRSTR